MVKNKCKTMVSTSIYLLSLLTFLENLHQNHELICHSTWDDFKASIVILQ